MRIVTLAAVLSLAAGSALAASGANPVTAPAKTCGKGYTLDEAATKCIHVKKASAAATTSTPAPATTPAAAAKSAPAKATTTAKNTDPTGATAKCKDGTYSHSTHASGTCSKHGGVATWLH